MTDTVKLNTDKSLFFYLSDDEVIQVEHKTNQTKFYFIRNSTNKGFILFGLTRVNLICFVLDWIEFEEIRQTVCVSDRQLPTVFEKLSYTCQTINSEQAGQVMTGKFFGSDDRLLPTDRAEFEPYLNMLMKYIFMRNVTDDANNK
jgi:hypothetical protein